MFKYLRKGLAELIYPEMEADRKRDNNLENWEVHRDAFANGYTIGHRDGVERGAYLERLSWTNPNRK